MTATDKIDTPTTVETPENVGVSTERKNLQQQIIDTQIDAVGEKVDNLDKNSTYELLKGTETEKRLLVIVNTPEFVKYGDTAEKRLETIFEKINTTLKSFLVSKFMIDTSKEQIPTTITEVLMPAIEWYLMDFLKENGNENNTADLSLANGISFESFTSLLSSVGNFAGKATNTYVKGKSMLKALDFLSVNKEILTKAKQSEILRNPLKCKEFLENPLRATDKDIFEISPAEVGITFGDEADFGLSTTEKQTVKDMIGNIEVVNSPKTTQLILGLVEKADPFLKAQGTLANQAMDLLDSADSSLGMLKSVLGIDIMKEIGDSELWKGVLDFVLSLLGVAGGFDGLQKRRHKRKIDKELDTTKRSQIESIFQEYLTQEKNNTNTANIMTTLFKGKIAFPQGKEDLFTIDANLLADAIDTKLTAVSSLNPAMVKTMMGTKYVETITEDQVVDGKTVKVKKDKIKTTEFEADKEKLIPQYIFKMTSELAKNADYLSNIDSADTVSFTIISSLFVQKDHVIDGIKAKVFLPDQFMTEEQQQATQTEAVTAQSEQLQWYADNLMFYDKIPWTEAEKIAFKAKVEEISKELQINPNRLMLVMMKESGLKHTIVNKEGGATGLIQFMPDTAKGLGTTTEALQQMSAVQQLEYVKKYYEKKAGSFKSYDDLRLYTFFPAAMGINDPTYVFETSSLSAQTIAQQNHRGKDKITMGDYKESLKTTVSENVPAEFKNQFTFA